MEVQHRLAAFRALRMEVIAVTPSRPKALAAAALPLEALCDPGRAAYISFGLLRGAWPMFLRPRVLARYLSLIAAGWRPRRGEPDEDMFQLGGDFILSSDRVLLYAYRGRDPSDRPTATELVDHASRLLDGG